MASTDCKKEFEWMRRVQSDGAVPLIDPDNGSNGWASPPGNTFMVRGPDYFSTKVKIPAGEFLLKPLGFDWIKSSTKIVDFLNNPNSRVRKIIADEFPTGDKPFIWAINLQVPSKDNYSAVELRLKLIASIVNGPWIVRKAVSEQAICIVGRSLSCKYCKGDNFIEVDVDIGSSMVASAIVHLAFNYITTITVDIAFLIESQTESELPERLLGAITLCDLNPASASTIEPSSDRSTGDVQNSLPTRLWKTIGLGFSQILSPVAQDGDSNSGPAHANGIVDGVDAVQTLRIGKVF
ncbi:hypothetical protein FNV43_RR02394 [Rhamnella rubrinervis]|uniref:Protein ENHANCED DISEASE RESISTANCE 2 C-terminal domain-containing protein n=1 Tax=Rhamnella rubrinervis TaxID=2594499 RepID=A0A8K0HS71_9ROSA|nr:hypothetical protein FNV43_RR02394 [Rhamnella rubrinervis]